MNAAARRYRAVLALLAIALLASIVLGVGLGAVGIAPLTTLRLFAWKLHLVHRGVSAATEVIVLQLRLPRVLLAVVVGAGLAAAGTVFQGLFRNPMADPAVIGVSSGAALGAVVVIVGGWAGALGGAGIPVAAFAGAIVTPFVVYRLARVGPVVQVATLLLAGIAVAAVVSAAMTLLMSFSGQQVRETSTSGSWEDSGTGGGAR